MKLWGIFRFEVAYQARRVWPWLFFVVVLALSYLVARDTSLADAMYEDFFANSPFAIAKTTVLGTLFWLLVAPAIAGEAAARDVATRMHPLAYTASVRKAEYLGGRWLAAFALNAAILLAVQAGILLAVYGPGVDPAALGPFWPAAHLTAYGFISLPNAILATALHFLLADRSGSAMASYAGSVFLVFMGFFVATLLNFLVQPGLGTLLDPIGLHFVIDDLAHDWTPLQRNTQLVALEGAVLRNRVLWLGVALGLLAVTYLRFDFAHRDGGGWNRFRRRRVAQPPTPAALAITSTPIVVPLVRRTFGFLTHVRQTRAIAASSFRAIATSWVGLGLLTVVPLLTILVVLDQMSAMGTPLVPRTARVLAELTGGFSAELAAEPVRWVIVPLLIVYFAGELVWREREAGLGEMTGAMPGSDWAPYLGKLGGLALFLAVLLGALMAAGMVAQARLGHRDFELALYAKVLFGLQLFEYLLFAVLALTLHVLVNHKYVGHLVSILAYAFIVALAALLGIEHELLVYGRSPGWSYTELRGFAGTVGPWLWFKLYWAAWAVLLAVVGKLCWVRGADTGFGVRLRLARLRVTRPTARVAGAAAGLVLALGGFVLYDTHVLDPQPTRKGIEERRAAYERRYGQFAAIPQPRPTAVRLHVELHPARRAVDIRGSCSLVNDGTLPIDAVHLTTAVSPVRTVEVRFDRPATPVVGDEELGYRIYALEEPLEPGATLRLAFEVRVEPRGFSTRAGIRSLAANGSAFDAREWVPSVGYRRMRELMSPGARRRHGLPERPVIASLHDVEGREPGTRGGGVAFEAVVGTDADQVAVAPGALRRSWLDGERRYFHYVTDGPIGEEWSFFSADYAVREGRWNDVAIRIFHHPGHTAHLERMLLAVEAALEYYGEQFGPYPHRHLTIVEHPGAPGTGAHAEASMIDHGQGFADWIPRDPASLDMPFFVVAHEMAHQWTVPYALVEGLPFLSEGLANYFAMQLVRETRGEEAFRQLLAFMREPYPFRPMRHGEPLLRALDPYLARRRGPFAMHALSEYVGVDRVNLAIRRLIEKHDAAGAPRATTLDLYRELQAVTPEPHERLLHDLFEVNTLWQFEARRIAAEQAADGTWRVALDVRARKIVYDAAGAEAEVPMDEWVPIGVFGPAADGGGALSAPLYVQKHRIRSGAQTIEVIVPRKPVRAGIDPYHLLDWEEGGEGDDNLREVAIAG